MKALFIPFILTYFILNSTTKTNKIFDRFDGAQLDKNQFEIDFFAQSESSQLTRPRSRVSVFALSKTLKTKILQSTMNPDWDFSPVVDTIYSEVGWQKDGNLVANKIDLIQRLNHSVSSEFFSFISK